MATAGDGSASCASGGTREKFSKRLFQPEINEDPQNVYQETGENVVREQLASPVELLKHPATMENLPDELLFNIFIRLLSRQLAQMRSVSKSWNGLLSQSSFIKSHLNRSVHNNNQTLLVFDRIFSNFKLPFTAHPCQSPHLELTNLIKLPVNPRPEYTNGIRVIGSVNGLICSSYSDSVIQIWNPSLSAVLTLPPYSMPSCDDDLIKIGFRFGFDPKTEDYKVVKLMCYGGLYCAVKRWLQVEVFSMRTGLWELIPQRFPSHVTGIRDDEVVCMDGPNGHLHWLGCTGQKMVIETIVAFDLGSETFREIPLPETTLDYISAYVLGVLSGKLCVISFVGLGALEVWVMEEYGVAESWVRRHGFSQFINDSYPYGFTSRGDFLINDNYKFVLYDPIANKTTIFKKLRDEIRNIGKIVEYVDSLVWVAPAEREKVDDAGQD